MNHNNLTNILKDLIHENVVIEFDEKTKSIKIEEPQNKQKDQLRSVKLTGISTFYFAFKLDDKHHPFLGKLIKADAKRIKKSVDAILFCKVGKKDIIFLIELKSNTASYLGQKIKSSKAFLAFLDSFFRSYENINLLENFKIMSVLFDRNPKKGGKLQTRPGKNDEIWYQYGFKNLDNELHIKIFEHVKPENI